MKDRNAKFFHLSALFRRRRNEISQIKINGRLVEGVPNLKEGIRDYFLQRFSREPLPNFDFDIEGHTKITAEQNAFLESLPSREEIKSAVWACSTEKAPGFDGFNFKFIREMWDEIKDDIYEFVTRFLECGSAGQSY